MVLQYNGYFSVVMPIMYIFHVSDLIDHLLYILCIGGRGVCSIFWVLDQNVSIAKDGRLFYGPHSGLTGAARWGIVKDMAKSGGGGGSGG